MGVFTWVKIRAPLQCCGFESNQWQSKDLMVEAGGRLMHIMHGCETITSLENVVSGEIHDWCSQCRQMSQYDIKDGQVILDGLNLQPPGA